jgi:hypothetical protein
LERRVDGYVAAMDAQPLIDLERAGWEALCDGTAGKFYDDVMTSDALMILANGQVMSRDQVVAALSDAPTWASFGMDEPQIVPVGDEAAALVYVGRAVRDSDAPPFVAAMTSVYVRDGGDWKLAVYQQTPVASDDGA